MQPETWILSSLLGWRDKASFRARFVMLQILLQLHIKSTLDPDPLVQRQCAACVRLAVKFMETNHSPPLSWNLVLPSQKQKQQWQPK